MVRKLAGLRGNAAVELFEEVKFEPSVMVEDLRPGSTLQAAQLEDGDIVIFQCVLSEASASRAPDLPFFIATHLI